MSWVRALSMTFGLLTAAGPASAGWLIEQGIGGPGDGLRQQVLVQANQMKTVTLGPDGKPASAFIVDLGSETITQVHYHDRSYVKSTVQEFTRMMRQAAEAGSAHHARAHRDLEQAMKNMPPEQRKQLEEAMRAQGAPKGGVECRDPQVDVRKTGQQATIAGYAATRYDLLVDGKVGSELWIAPEITAWQELDARKLERFFAQMAAGASCGQARSPGGLGGDWSWKMPRDGYAVRMVTSGGPAVEVTRAERRTIAAAEFLPPAGFAPKPLPKLAP